MSDALKKQMFKEEDITSALTKMLKVGAAPRSKSLELLEPMAVRLREKYEEMVVPHFPNRETGILYDVYYYGAPDDPQLTYTELCSNALYIHPCCNELRFQQIRDAVDLADDSIDYCARILESAEDGSLDKYRLTRQLGVKPMSSIVMLPGSNTYRDFTDVQMIKYLINKEDAKIKPHPITNEEARVMQHKFLGKENFIHHNASGMDLIKAARKVYTTGGSETAFYAVMLGKEIGSIEPHKTPIRPAYRAIFDELLRSPNPYKTLNYIFNSHMSGIIFHWDSPKKLDDYLKYNTNVILKHQ